MNVLAYHAAIGYNKAVVLSNVARSRVLMMQPSENLILLKDVPDRIPPGSRGRVTYSTVWRWIHQGQRGIKLETLYIGGSVYTSNEAIERFISAVSAARQNRPDPMVQADRTKRAEASRRRLAARGV